MAKFLAEMSIKFKLVLSEVARLPVSQIQTPINTTSQPLNLATINKRHLPDTRRSNFEEKTRKLRRQSSTQNSNHDDENSDIFSRFVLNQVPENTNQSVQDFLLDYPTKLQTPDMVHLESGKFPEEEEEDNNSTLLAEIENDIEKLVRKQLDLAAIDWAKAKPEAGSIINHSDDFSLLGHNYSSFIDQNNYDDFISYLTKSSQNTRIENHEEESRNNKLHWNHNYKQPKQDRQHQSASTPQDPLSTSSDGSTIYASTELYSSAPYQPNPPAPDYRNNKNHHLANQLISKYMYRLRGPITSSMQQPLQYSARKLASKLAMHTTTLAPNIVRAFERLDRMRQSSGTSYNLEDASELKPAHEPATVPGKINSEGFMDGGGGPIHSNGQQLVSLGLDYAKRTSNPSNELAGDVAGSSLSTGERNNGTGNNKLPLAQKDSSEIGQFKLGQTNSGSVNVPSIQQNQSGEPSLAVRLNANRNKNKMRTNGLKSNAPQGSLSNLLSTEQKQPAPIEPLTLNLDSLVKGRLRANLLDPTSSPVQYYTPPPPPTKPIVRPLLRSSTTSKPISMPPANLAPALYAAALNHFARSRLQSTTAAETTTTTTTTRMPPVTIAASPSGTQLRFPSAQHHHLHSHIHSIKPALISIPVPLQPKLVGASSYTNLLASLASPGSGATIKRPPSNLRLRQAELPAQKKYQLLSSSIPIGGTLVKQQNQLKLSSNRVNQQSSESQLGSSLVSSIVDSAYKALRAVSKGNSASGQSNKVGRGQPATNQRGGEPDHWRHQQSHLNQASQQQSHGQFDPLGTVSLYQSTSSDEDSPIETYLTDLLGNQATSLNHGGATSGSEHQLLFNELQPILLPMLPPLSATGNYPILKPSASNKQLHMYPLVDWDSKNNNNSDGGLDKSTTGDGVIFGSIGDDSNFLYPILTSSPSDSFAGSPLDPVGLLQAFNQHAQSASEEHSNLVSAYDSPDWPMMASFADDQDEPTTANNHSSSSSSSSGYKLHNSRPTKSSRNKTIDNNDWQTPPGKVGSINSDSMDYALSHYADEQAQPGTYKHSKGPASLHYDMFDDKSNPRFPQEHPIEVYSTSDGTGGFQPISEQSLYRLNGKQQQGFRGNPQESDNLQYKQNRKQQSLRSLNEHKYKQPHGNNPQSVPLYQPPIQPTHVIQFHYPSLINQAAQGSQQSSTASSILKPHLLAASDLINYHKQQLIDNHFLAHHYNPNVMQKSHSMVGHHHLHHPRDMATSETVQFPVASLSRASLLAHHFWPLALAMLPIMIIVAIVAQLVMAAPLVMFAITTLTVSRFAALMSGLPLNSRELADFLGSPPGNSTSDILNKLAAKNFTIEETTGSGSQQTSGSEKPVSIRRRAPRGIRRGKR